MWKNPKKRKLSPKKCIEMKFKKFSFCCTSNLKYEASNSANNSIASSTFSIKDLEKPLVEQKKQAGLHILQRNKMLMRKNTIAS